MSSSISSSGLRVLHVAHMRKPQKGIIRQMEFEQLAADALGIPWEAVFYAPEGVEGDVVVNSANNTGWYAFKSGFYAWLQEKSKDFDLILLRYPMYDPLQLKFIATCPVPVATMHHTLEVPELHSNANFRSHLLAMLESIVGPMVLRRTAAVKPTRHSPLLQWRLV